MDNRVLSFGADFVRMKNGLFYGFVVVSIGCLTLSWFVLRLRLMRNCVSENVLELDSSAGVRSSTLRRSGDESALTIAQYSATRSFEMNMRRGVGARAGRSMCKHMKENVQAN
mmetsp:Transcript_24404/g.41025  ORF Transcript_24404/g.41025 Transcript_24404/m.41025 type:complete len:113 (-) Transcript_24404:14-352(-)